jgi:hypothetical protein
MDPNGVLASLETSVIEHTTVLVLPSRHRTPPLQFRSMISGVSSASHEILTDPLLLSFRAAPVKRGGLAVEAHRLRLVAGGDRHAARTRKLNRPTAARFPAPHHAQCWSSMNCPKKSASASYASSGSTFATCWSGRTTIIAPLSRSMPRRSKIFGPFLRSGV